LILWRSSNYEDLSGVGDLKIAGRWHHAGKPVVYLAEHPALALLETLVHLEIRALEDLPETYKLLRVEVPDNIGITESTPEAGWQSQPGDHPPHWRHLAGCGGNSAIARAQRTGSRQQLPAQPAASGYRKYLDC
jgi:RES domain-containing protein